MVNEAKWPVTLHAISRLSKLCYRIRWLWFALAAAASLWFAALLASGVANSARMLLPLSLLLWSALGLCAAYWLAFAPAAAASSDNLLIKAYKSLKLIVYIGVIVVILGLATGAVMLTLRGITLGIG